MKIRTALASGLLAAVAASAAADAPPEYLFVSRSSETLMDDATAKALFDEIVSAKLARLYPTRTWGFAAQVEGGITQANACVVVARVMLLPRNQPIITKLLLFKPQKMATAFDALPNSSTDACRALAKDKLKEATAGVVSALVKT